MTSAKQRRHVKAMQKLGAAASKKKKDDKRHLILVRRFLENRNKERRKLRQKIETLKRNDGERVGEEGARLILFHYYKNLNDGKESQALEAIENDLGIEGVTVQALIERFEGTGELGSPDARSEVSGMKKKRHMKVMQMKGASATKNGEEERRKVSVQNFAPDRTVEREVLKSTIGALRRRQGERVGPETARLVLHAYYTHLYNDLEVSQALRAIRDNLGVTQKIVETVRERFEETGECGTHDSRRGRPSVVFTPDLQDRLREKIVSVKATGKRVTWRLLQEWLRSDPNPDDPEDNDRQPVEVSPTTVARWVGQIGCSI